MANIVCHFTCSLQQYSECHRLQCKKRPPGGRGAVNNKPTVENKVPAKCATANNKSTKFAVIQEKSSSSTTTIENSKHTPPKDIATSSQSNSTILTILPHLKNSSTLLSLNSLWEFQVLSRY